MRRFGPKTDGVVINVSFDWQLGTGARQSCLQSFGRLREDAILLQYGLLPCSLQVAAQGKVDHTHMKIWQYFK